jgi:uncharacterized RDD family membrane protein YckC/cytoskeletal protein CcmA (bactofilin family)
MNTSLRGVAVTFGLFLALAATACAQPPSNGPDADGGSDFGSSGGQSGHSQKNDRVQFFGSNQIGADENIAGDAVAIMGSNSVAGAVSHDVVAIMGSNSVEGDVSHDLVAVMGSNTVDGSVGHDAVAVMGEAFINGTVDHDVVAVAGSVTLGPSAIVRGDVVCVGGTLRRSPGATVQGRVVTQSFGFGQPMRFLAPDIVWRHDRWRSDPGEIFQNFYHSWRGVFALFSLCVYALLAILFPEGIRRCGNVLSQRPMLTILTGLLALLAVPLIFILLLVTVVGIPVAILVLPCAIVAAGLFGKAALYSLLGRSLSHDRMHPASAVLLGGALCTLIYLIPILGTLASIFISILGFGCAITALLSSSLEPSSPPPIVVPAAAPPAVAPVQPEPPPPDNTPAAASVGATSPAVHSETFSAALPRAGFWIRMGALFIDSIIVGAACGSLFPQFSFFYGHFRLDGTVLPLATYGALMWKFKGTTIGGMICGLRVVRLDDRPVDWETSIVRALGCFLSMFLGLGFFWIAIDKEKQAWHDKIAGTVVVRTKGISLV